MSAQIQLPDNWRAHIDDAARDCASGALIKSELSNPHRPPLVVVRDTWGNAALLCVDPSISGYNAGLYRLGAISAVNVQGVGYWPAADVIAVGLGDAVALERMAFMYPSACASLIVDACAAWTTLYGISDDEVPSA